jgi:hypothetical protein
MASLPEADCSHFVFNLRALDVSFLTNGQWITGDFQNQVECYLKLPYYQIAHLEALEA